MRLSEEQLLSIDYLMVGDRLGDLDGDRMDRYCGLLAEFVEDFPGIEASLKKALFIGDKETLSHLLSELLESLTNIYADGLARECETVKAAVADAAPETLEADLTAFLSTVGTLSVDIQMEQHKSEEAEAAAEPKVDSSPAVPADSTKNILAVDDIPITLNLLKIILQKAGYKFTGVTSGAAALDFISKFTPDLFILDIEMPKMNGFDLAAKIREAGQSAPLVFLTGNTTREYLLRAIRIGAVDFIVKPVNADRVLTKIGKIFETAK